MTEEGDKRARKRDRPARKYGFACSNCRKRKARCDGAFPTCDRCMANNETCRFDKAPSVTFALMLQNRIKSVEALLERLRAAGDAERLQILEAYFRDGGVGNRNAADMTSIQQETSPQSDISVEDDLAELFNETSVDEYGRLCFYGSTSLFHVQLDSDALDPNTRMGTTPAAIVPSGLGAWETDQQGHSCGTSIIPGKKMSDIAETDVEAALGTEYGSRIREELLETYWCWPHHLHLVLSRKLFMRDVATFGPYVTPFLLNAVLSQAARYSDRPEASILSEHFAQAALISLPTDLDKGSSIPTIQGLLIFSARECGCGRTSQGWLYSGMAFRMMRDIGIHIHPRKLNHLVGHFTPTEMAMRQQLFWSCYTWDKTMSLCLGRPPTMHDSIPLPTAESMVDGLEAENEPWIPKFTASAGLEVGSPQKARTTSRFVAYCLLCMIIDDVLETLYTKGHGAQSQMVGFLDRTIQRLDSWKRELPPHLYAAEDSRLVSCPPLHILLLNLLYHATVILLCRPYRSKQEQARKMATQAAEMIDRLLMLHIRRFGFRVITYLESYTTFVASTVNILDMNDGIDADNAGNRLALNLEILRNASSTPSNARCVKIIEQLLSKNAPNADNQPTNLDDRRSMQVSGSHSTVALDDVPLERQSQTGMDPAAPGPSSTHPAALDFSNMGDPQYSSLFDQNSTSSVPNLQPVMPMIMDSGVERPLRWLSDNVGSNYEWMMTGAEFSNALNGQVPSMWDLSDQE